MLEPEAGDPLERLSQDLDCLGIEGAKLLNGRQPVARGRHGHAVGKRVEARYVLDGERPALLEVDGADEALPKAKRRADVGDGARQASEEVCLPGA